MSWYKIKHVRHQKHSQFAFCDIILIFSRDHLIIVQCNHDEIISYKWYLQWSIIYCDIVIITQNSKFSCIIILLYPRKNCFISISIQFKFIWMLNDHKLRATVFACSFIRHILLNYCDINYCFVFIIFVKILKRRDIKI